MNKKLFFLITLIIGLPFISGISLGTTPFYEGKTIRIIVGFSPGGGYDIYARTIARHMGKFIPGKPTVIVENMPGAGSLISANHLYKVAKPDGLTLGHFSGGFFFNQVMGQPGVEFDAKKFIYMGAPMKGGVACVLTKASGIHSIEKWMASKTPIKLGGVSTGAFVPDNCIKILKEALGLPIHLVSGYKGISEIRLAAESGELTGTVVGSWPLLKASWRNLVEAGDVVIVLQAVPKPFPDLPNVPLAINLAKNEEARQLIEIGIHSNSMIIWPFVLPPGTPKDRVQILVKAFQDALKDKELLAEAEKSKLYLDPVTSEDLEKAVGDIFKLSPVMLSKMKEILFK